MVELFCDSVEKTMALGETIAGQLKDGSVVILQGGLGSGKTCLTKGIARGLGIDEPVTSPTYTIVCEYKGQGGLFDFYHIDAYRLSCEDDFEGLGLAEVIGIKGVFVIEWGEKVAGALPKDAIKINIEIAPPGSDSRKIQIYGLELDL